MNTMFEDMGSDDLMEDSEDNESDEEPVCPHSFSPQHMLLELADEPMNMKALKTLLQELDDLEDPELDHFLETHNDVEIGEAGPGPSMITNQECTSGDKNTNEDTRAYVNFEGAGAVISMNEKTHDKWKHLFGTKEKFTNDSQPDSVTAYAPFKSEIDWRIERWAVKDGIRHKSLDRLLLVPGVCP